MASAYPLRCPSRRIALRCASRHLRCWGTKMLRGRPRSVRRRRVLAWTPSSCFEISAADTLLVLMLMKELAKRPSAKKKGPTTRAAFS